MKQKIKRILIWAGIVLAGLILIGAGFVLGWQGGLPLQLVDHYSLDRLQEEAVTMGECAECHTGEEFHSCVTCHDDHGAVEFAGLPFFNLISFSGDVPQPGYLEINQILPYRDHPNTQIGLLEFLAEQGVEEFESLTLTSRDGGFVTITRDNLSDQAMLLPFVDGIRFAAEDLHVSTWVKGITGMIVVGIEHNLILDGEPTSLGRLLIGPTREVVVENARVMFASENDGEIREAETAARIWGAALSDLAPAEGYAFLLVRDELGGEYRIDPDQARLAVLAQREEGPVLVLPGAPRAEWITEVAELSWEK